MFPFDIDQQKPDHWLTHIYSYYYFLFKPITGRICLINIIAATVARTHTHTWWWSVHLFSPSVGSVPSVVSRSGQWVHIWFCAPGGLCLAMQMFQVRILAGPCAPNTPSVTDDGRFPSLASDGTRSPPRYLSLHMPRLRGRNKSSQTWINTPVVSYNALWLLPQILVYIASALLTWY